MTDFVLEVEKGTSLQGSKLKQIVNYANFLKQPLKLEMFVPCDDEGNILEEPKQTSLTCSFFEQQQFFNKQKKYENAKEKVLFKGFKKDFNSVLGPDGYLDISKLQGKTIEDIIASNLQLTESALKQIGL